MALWCVFFAPSLFVFSEWSSAVWVGWLVCLGRQRIFYVPCITWGPVADHRMHLLFDTHLYPRLILVCVFAFASIYLLFSLCRIFMRVGVVV